MIRLQLGHLRFLPRIQHAPFPAQALGDPGHGRGFRVGHQRGLDEPLLNALGGMVKLVIKALVFRGEGKPLLFLSGFRCV